jgi:hypothetical protein
MIKGFELSEEDAVVADMIDFFLINEEMLPYFVFYYRKLHPELDDLLEPLEELLEDVKYKAKNSWNSYEDRLYNGYKDYPREYFLFLCGALDGFSEKISNICLDIRKYIVENEEEEQVSDIVKILEEESKIELQVQKMELHPREAFLENPYWFHTNIYTPRSLGMITNKLWKTKWKTSVKRLLLNSIEEIPYKRRSVGSVATDFLLKDVLKHIDVDIKKEVEQLLSEKRTVESEESKKPEDNVIKENHDEKCDTPVDELKEQIESSLKIGTMKALYSAWDSVIKSEKSEYYTIILNVYAHVERFPLKFLRKEISKHNKPCIEGILKSRNEKSIRFLFAVLWNGIVQNKDESLLEIKDAINIPYRYSSCRSFIDLRNPHPIYLYVLYISAIFHSKEHIKTSDDLWNILYSGSNHNEFLYDIIYEMLSKKNILSEKLKSFIGYSFYHNTLKDCCDKNWDGMYMQDYSDAYLIYSTLISWSRNEEIKLEDIDKYQSRIIGWEQMYRNLLIRARIILNANFIVPKYSEENEKRVRQLLYPKKTFYEFKIEKAENENIPILMIDENILWKEYWKVVIMMEQFEIYNKWPIKSSPISLPIESEYEEYILSRSDDIFTSCLDTLMVHEFKEFLFRQRERNIMALKAENFLNEEEEKKLLELIGSANYYGLSKEEIKNCLAGEKDEEWWKIINTRLEAEFMNHIFAKCLLWVIKFDKSELMKDDIWWGMKIFSKSFIDRPRVWATQLLKILNEKLKKKELLRVCFALGHLREPLQGMVPKELKRIADEQNPKTKEIILRQYSLFNRGNLKKGKHIGNEKKRVEKCFKELLKISQKRFE